MWHFFFVLCVIPDISCFNPPPPPSSPRLPFRHSHAQHAHAHLRHTHIQTFHFLCVRSPGRGRAARFSATCSGRKTGRGVQGCPTCKARRVRGGNPELPAELHFRQRGKFDAILFVFRIVIMCCRVCTCMAKMFERKFWKSIQGQTDMTSPPRWVALCYC